ncbi:putative quinol monooxygenase [Subtercola endophyticus]|uniref:putative quinol monooxygenase n=1 Tax=Subtercola endophyticus TaxID=2895559 RepID=UPI001E5C8BA3|nr:putative quinol monooxygenase [Subtercola endophyticus]UFS58815.1 antibiotic biosynthesis monooxygenase [Subtercola endophyticus]
MTKPGCTLTATLQAKPERREELRDLLESFVPKSRSEDGCIEYVLQVSDEDENTFMFYENWVSKDHLDRHMALPYQLEWFERQPELLAAPARMHFYTLVTDYARA